MKVLHVLNELMASGAEVMMCRSAQCWREAGVEGEILSTGAEVGPYAAELVKAGYPIHHIPFRKDPRFFWSFFQLVRSGQYDVVHVHSERAAFYYGLVAKLAGARIVHTVHSTFEFGGFLAFRRKVQRGISRLLGGQWVSISPSVQRNELERFGNRTTLVLNWYDDHRFHPPTDREREEARKKYGIAPGAIVIVSVGNCAPVKNHPELLKALALLKETPFVYLHVGREDPGAPERQLAEELGIADHVQFLGYTVDTLPPLHAADIYVMPSLYEGFGVAAVEALAVGIPSVFSDVAGLRDLKGIPGTFWAKPRADSLSDTLARVAALSTVERESIRRQAPGYVRDRYGMGRGVRAYVDVYRELVHQR